MCFSKPKPNLAQQQAALPDPELARQAKERREAAQTERAAAKMARSEQNMAQLNGLGRRSLLTGGGGGAGFAAPSARPLLVAAK